MALGPRLDLRQTQSLKMTPQLQQAIKLLALSNLELETFIGDALDANPLLDMGETSEGPTEVASVEAPAVEGTDATADQLMLAGHGEADAPLDIDPDALDRDRDTGDHFLLDRTAGSSGSGEDGPGIDERGAGELTLAQHLEAQAG